MTFLDMTGKPCPMPVIETKKVLKTALPGDEITILVDNDIARQNLQKMAINLGHEFNFKTNDDGSIKTVIKILEQGRIADEDNGGGLVVAVGHESMGGPSEELGGSLMKSFIYSLTELETPPEQLLFYNGGVKLATEGAATLDDLEVLAAKGTLINSCGACLNYYGLVEKLKVGTVTNMYAIVSTMGQAKKLINI